MDGLPKMYGQGLKTVSSDFSERFVVEVCFKVVEIAISTAGLISTASTAFSPSQEVSDISIKITLKTQLRLSLPDLQP